MGVFCYRGFVFDALRRIFFLLLLLLLLLVVLLLLSLLMSIISSDLGLGGGFFMFFFPRRCVVSFCFCFCCYCCWLFYLCQSNRGWACFSDVSPGPNPMKSGLNREKKTVDAKKH